MTTFTAISNSTIYDVCLNTYGTLNLLGKLMKDNNFDGVNAYPVNGQEFIYDETLVNIQSLSKFGNYTVTGGANKTKYATK
jgi:hypothetical protein